MKRSKARLPESIEFARDQRRTSNEFTATVWQWVRNRQICGAKFRREHSIPPYTVDFCCLELRLIIEIDGEGHFTKEGMGRDRARDQYLRDLGFRILRIPGYAVIREDGDAIQKIREFVASADTGPSPSPPSPSICSS
ncbi:MAG: endonuclease domain-containing protein [Planctomycetaceae bacterium]